MLKYQNVAKVGDRIRAYDFHENTEIYIEGKVTGIRDHEASYFAFIIIVDKDIWPDQKPNSPSRVGTKMYVPMETLHDWEGRVTKLAICH